MKKSVEECLNCNAMISSRVERCPWCGIERAVDPSKPLRKKMSLGALITIMTLAALLLWLMSLDAFDTGANGGSR